MMMMMMKKPIVLMTCILLVSSLAVVASQNSFGPENCCFQFIPRKLNKKQVTDYRYTDTRCAQQAVVFTMKKGAKLCARASEDWVKKTVIYIESQNANSTTSTY